MSDKSRTKKKLERRTPGIKAMPAPKPRPLPLNHPAKLIFRGEIGEDQLVSFETGTPASIPASIPTTSPEGIPTGMPEPISLSNHNLLKEQPEVQQSYAELQTDLTAPLDATHTSSEKNIYSLMYRDTISKGIRDRHFGPAELMRKSGIRSRNTVHRALYGLIEKLSIEVLTNHVGNPMGPRYRVYKPREIEQRRKAVGIKIDPQTKKIIREDRDKPSIPSGIPKSIPDSMPAGMGKIWDTTIPENERGTIPKFGIHFKKKNNIGEESSTPASSSSKSEGSKDSDDDALFLDSLRQFYEQVTGNMWTTADAMTAHKGRNIPVEIWSIAICYCVDRAPGHRFERLAYVLEEARNHYQEMKEMSLSDLRAIMRHASRTIERARSSGAWEVNAAQDS